MTAGTRDVVVACIHSHDVTYSWHRSMMGTVLYDQENGRRLANDISVKCGSGGLVEARNEAVAAFLSGPGDWLWTVDTDMGWAPDALHRLLEVADPESRPVVGALCFAWIESEPDGMGGWLCGTRPTIFQFGEHPEAGKTFAAVQEYPADTLVQCAATGAACILMHRSTLEAMHAEHGPTWYDRIRSENGKLLGEDISFCARAASVGATVHVHTGVPTNHQKTVWISHHQHPPATPQPSTQVETFDLADLG